MCYVCGLYTPRFKRLKLGEHLYVWPTSTLVFNINICRFSTSRPVFDINNMFGEKRFDSTEMATSFRNAMWRQPPSLNSILVLISDSTVAFNIKFASSPPSSVRIGQIGKKLQKSFAIQDGGSRHLDIWWNSVYWLFSAFHFRCSTFPPSLVHIGRIEKKWQQLFGLQDGGRRHIELYCMCISNITVAF